MRSEADPFAIEILPIAQEDMYLALSYIAADNVDAANKLLDGIQEAMKRASNFPFSGTEIIVGRRRLRRYFRLYVPPYCIYYRVIEDKIVIMRILHERMDVKRHL